MLFPLRHFSSRSRSLMTGHIATAGPVASMRCSVATAACASDAFKHHVPSVSFARSEQQELPLYVTDMVRGDWPGAHILT